MRYSCANEQEMSFTPTALIEQGLQHIRQGRCTEGVVYLVQAREHMALESMQDRQLANVLDLFTRGHSLYWQVEQALHEASRRFAEVYAEQQKQLAALEALLPAVHRELQLSTPVKTGENRATTPQPLLPSLATPSIQRQQKADGTEQQNVLPALHITCFGRFELHRQGQPLSLCTNRNGQSILRYLIAQSDHRATMDVLMSVFWPDDEQEAAHHKLQVAVSALRRSLNNGYTSDGGGGYILCKQGTYQLNPLVSYYTDVDEFIRLYQAGREADAATMHTYYEQACLLYTGPFLVEDLYADWSSLRREQLSHAYLGMCSALAEHAIKVARYDDVLTWATAILKENHCDESAYRQLMLAYAAQGRRSEALRQYHRCQQVLFEELGVEPMPETVELFHKLLSAEQPQK